jgi:hypothetical protein
MKYFLIHVSEDGDIYLSEYTAEQLEKMLNGPDPEYRIEDFLDKVPDRNLAYWGGRAILIKGEIVVPKAKEVVTKVTLGD